MEIREELLKMGILDKKRTSPMKIRTSKEDISKLEKSGHFYFALTQKNRLFSLQIYNSYLY
ncbi:MAG: hypothetical protein LVR00_03475 [Rhabdochlamydiaceae bacterium]